jgi:uncharacterized protein (DUF1501 family)
MSEESPTNESDESTVLGAAVDRRRFMAGAGITAGSLAATAYLSPALFAGTAGAEIVAPGAAVRATRLKPKPKPTMPSNNILVVLYLRGGFDGLSALAPISDSEYYAQRPTIAVPAASALPIDANWGLHPALVQIKALHDAGKAAFVPAAGAPFVNRSHFTAQPLTEIAVGDTSTFSTGWLARYLKATAGTSESPLRSFSANAVMPYSLAGAFSPSAASLASFKVNAGGNFANDSASVTKTLNKMYRSVSNPLLKAQALSAISAVNAVNSKVPSATAPKGLTSGLGTSLFQIARLINAGLPVEIATADLANFDFHAAIGSATSPKGGQYGLFAVMDAAIGAFFTYLGTNASRVTLVTMTEFGRRIAENSSGGVDHGHGSTMMVLGGGVNSGVKGDWPGLTNTIDGDVIVANDYRTVLAEIVAKRLRPVDMATVFPNFTVPSHTGVIA